MEREAIAEEEAAAGVEVRSCRIINVAVRQKSGENAATRARSRQLDEKGIENPNANTHTHTLSSQNATVCCRLIIGLFGFSFLAPGSSCDMPDCGPSPCCASPCRGSCCCCCCRLGGGPLPSSVT